jgi:hypothetical protein
VNEKQVGDGCTPGHLSPVKIYTMKGLSISRNDRYSTKETKNKKQKTVRLLCRIEE